MLKYNNTPIEDIYPLEIADEGDTRPRAWSNAKYIKGSRDRVYDDRPELTYFKNNGNRAEFAGKGMSPRNTLRYSITSNPSTGLWYIIKIKDGSIWLTSKVYAQPWTIERLSTTAEQFEIIPAEEDACKLYIEMCGAGGGGSGGGGALCGAGGGGGASACFAITMIGTELRNDDTQYVRKGVNRYVCYVGTGGQGVQDRNQAGDGGPSGFSGLAGNYMALNSDISIICHGGKGANASDGGAPGTVEITSGGCYPFPTAGCKGGDESGYSTTTFNQVTINMRVAGISDIDVNEQQEIVHGPYSVESTYTGAGGNSAFGPGAEPSTYTDINGKNGTYPGTGGSGGSAKAFNSSRGGNGANGVINIYY